MLSAGKRKALPHEIVKMVMMLQSGAQMDKADSLACAKLILDLENERRKMASLADSAGTVIKAREADWKGQLAEANKTITALKSDNKDMCARIRAIATQCEAIARKFRAEPARDRRTSEGRAQAEAEGAYADKNDAASAVTGE